MTIAPKASTMDLNRIEEALRIDPTPEAIKRFPYSFESSAYHLNRVAFVRGAEWAQARARDLLVIQPGQERARRIDAVVRAAFGDRYFDPGLAFRHTIRRGRVREYDLGLVSRFWKRQEPMP